MGLALVGIAQPVIYDATADFTPDLPNPNGVWSYGYTTDLSTALIPLANYTTSIGTIPPGDAFGWFTDVSLRVPTIFKYIAATPGFGLAAGQLVLHPGPTSEFAVLAFTAPAAGQYVLNAQFFAGDSGGTDATIVLNGNTASPVVYFPDTGVSPMFTGSLALAQGDQVRFAVGNAGSFIADSTPLTATLTFSPIPEPGASALLLGLGGIAATLACRRQRRPFLETNPRITFD